MGWHSSFPPPPRPRAQVASEPLGLWSNFPLQNPQPTERCLETQSNSLSFPARFLYCSGFWSMVPRPAPSASPWNLLAVQLLWPHLVNQKLWGGAQELGFNLPPGDADMHSSGPNLRTTGRPTAPSSPLPRTHSLPSAVSSLPLCSIFFSSSSTHHSSGHCPHGWLQEPSRRWPQLQPTLPQSSLHLETRTVFWEGKGPYQYLTYSPAISSNFSQFNVTKGFDLHLLGSATSSQLPNPTQHKEWRKRTELPVCSGK